MISALPAEERLVDVTPASHGNDEDEERVVADLVHEAMVAHAYPVEVSGAGELLRTGRAWIFGQGVDMPGEALAGVGGELAELTRRLGREFYRIGQG